MFWFVSRKIWKSLVYDWDILNIDYVIDEQQTHEWHANFSQNWWVFEEASFFVYWKRYNIKMPYMSNYPEDLSDHTDKFDEYIRDNVKKRLLSDVILWIRDKILLTHHLVWFKWSNWKLVLCFKTEEEREDKTKKIEWKQKWFLVAMKEFMMGYVRVNPYKIAVKDPSWWESFQEIKLHSSYSDDKYSVDNNYTVAMRTAMFRRMKENLNADQLLMNRQYDAHLLQARRTFLTASRRSGKTVLWALFLLREMFRDSFSFQTSIRPISVIYIGMTHEDNNAVLQYINSLIAEMLPTKADRKMMFRYDSEFHTLYLQTSDKVIAQARFVSAKWFSWWVWSFADLIIIDECGKIPYSVYEWVEPIVHTEWAKLLCISTLYKDSRKGWFFEKLVDSENKMNNNIIQYIRDNWDKYKDLNLEDKDDQRKYDKLVDDFYVENEYVGLRFTIDDIEYMTEHQRQVMKDEYSKDPIRYMTELYSRFPDEWAVLDYEPTLTAAEKVEWKIYKYICVWYDPALTADQPALVVSAYDESRKKIVILEEKYLTKKAKYEVQYLEIKVILDKYKKFTDWTVFFAMDWSQKGTAEVFELLWLSVHSRIVYTSWRDINNKSDIYNEIKVPKKILVEYAKDLFDNNKIILNMNLKELIWEMDNFQAIELPSWAIKYEAISGTDDMVNAMLVSIFYIYHQLWAKYYVMSKTEVEKTTGLTYWERKDRAQRKRHRKEMNMAKQKALEHNQQYFRSNVY